MFYPVFGWNPGKKKEGLTCLDEVKEVLTSGLKAPCTYKAKARLAAKNGWLSTTTSLQKFTYMWMVDTDSVPGGPSQNDTEESHRKPKSGNIWRSKFQACCTLHVGFLNLVELHLLLEKIQDVLDRALAFARSHWHYKVVAKFDSLFPPEIWR